MEASLCTFIGTYNALTCAKMHVKCCLRCNTSLCIAIACRWCASSLGLEQPLAPGLCLPQSVQISELPRTTFSKAIPKRSHTIWYLVFQ